MYTGLILPTLLILFVIVLLASMLMQLWVYVPFVPSEKSVRNAMLDAAELKPGMHVYDLGAGDARMLLDAYKREPAIHAVGYEVTTLVWLLGKLRIALRRAPIAFYRKDFAKASFEDADVFLLYLSPKWMRILYPKLRAEVRPGTRIISHAFSFRDIKPTRVIELPRPFGNPAKIFVYDAPL